MMEMVVTTGAVRGATANKLKPKFLQALPVSQPTVSVFRKKVKTHLFRQSYPDVIF